MAILSRACSLLLILSCLLAASKSHSLPKSHNSKPTVKPLSDEIHYANEEKTDHNPEFDHEAFLGKEEAKTFEDLTVEESRQRLGLIFDKIDENRNGYVSESELQKWILKIQNRYALTEAEKNWSEIKPHRGDSISWEEHQLRTYGNIEAIENGEDDIKEMVSRDKKRWDVADKDKDGFLTKTEYASFLHPETSEDMKDIVVDETLEEIDTDHDGFVSLQEFLDDLTDEDDNSQDDIEWLEAEERDFREELDKDQDGRLNREEMAAWLHRDDFDQAQEEMEHLFSEADIDQDKNLSKDEVLSKHELFVGSQATDYGDILGRHDEF